MRGFSQMNDTEKAFLPSQLSNQATHNGKEEVSSSLSYETSECGRFPVSRLSLAQPSPIAFTFYSFDSHYYAQRDVHLVGLRKVSFHSIRIDNSNILLSLSSAM